MLEPFDDDTPAKGRLGDDGKIRAFVGHNQWDDANAPHTEHMGYLAYGIMMAHWHTPLDGPFVSSATPTPPLAKVYHDCNLLMV